MVKKIKLIWESIDLFIWIWRRIYIVLQCKMKYDFKLQCRMKYDFNFEQLMIHCMLWVSVGIKTPTLRVHCEEREGLLIMWKGVVDFMFGKI
jgi:hypothetical protein